MQLDDFDFELPEQNIALRPLLQRDQARLLHVKNTQVFDRHVFDLPQILKPNDLLIVNNTKVIPARLNGIRQRGENRATIEVTLIKRLSPTAWTCFAKPAKRVKIGDQLHFGVLTAEVTRREEAEIDLSFNIAPKDMENALFQAGTMPLPPYIASKRPPDDQDDTDYQTEFARYDGAVAAPTAGLHFTPDLINDLKTAGIRFGEVTLHVGAGTFLPVKVDKIEGHDMHAEWGKVTQETIDLIQQTKADGGRVIAVGTTSLRILESAAESGTLRPFEGDTRIFIYPGYKFQVIDALITNFHLPRSTLLMLVSALAGLENIRNAYAHAIRSGYRFYSYGDACFLEKNDLGDNVI